MLNKTDQLALFSCCIPVKGARRSIICDVQREKIHLIPNTLCDILLQHPTLQYQALIEHLPESDHETIDEYLNFLLENELAHITDQPQLFPKMSPHWQTSSAITNCIVDILDTDSYWFQTIVQLSDLNCKHVQIRFYAEQNAASLEAILNSLQGTTVQSLELILTYSPWMTPAALGDLQQKHSRIFSIVVFNAHYEAEKNMYLEMGKMLFLPEALTSEQHCGIIHSTLFNINIPTFTESLHHNSCLNKKIAVDKNGHIKNCPSMQKSFGHIGTTTLKQALDHPDFKKLWNTTKDQIDTCRQCEFRYICTDCRAYLENPDDPLSKPLKCGYNPHNCQWEDWSTNPLKQRAIDQYGMQDILPEFKLQPDYEPKRQPASY